MEGATVPAAFAAMPLEAQLAHLERRLASDPADDLLELCASLADPAPLAWLCARLLERGHLAESSRRAAFARFLVRQAETAVHASLRAMTTKLGPASADGFALALIESLRAAPLARLPTTCVIDRTLKHHCGPAWEAFVVEHAAACEARMACDGPTALSLEDLALLPARALESLREAARRVGEDSLRNLDERVSAMARAAIAALGAQPKALSQSNAEELLARRVYTDPGHFLIELLQNAEDAGARAWRVSFERTRVVVWHDGTPFDARDLVGVTSIGQTTKRKQQIGFFGVGFKSVYEITDRPQIYSGFYQLEIADVSIPRSLAARPADLPADGTVLVLPLRNAGDAERSPAALYKRATALDPCVLLTLRSIASIEFVLDAGDASGPRRHRVARERATSAGFTALRREPEGGTRVYALAERDVRYEGGAREAARPDRTRVLVGLRVDDAGIPRALPPGSSTVYSYLPTAERSGLRFFVQGHFDVPVDRERIAENSAWNRWILSHVPALLADAARVVTDPGLSSSRRFDAARGLLDVLPLAAEVSSPALGDVSGSLTAAFADLAILPGNDGGLHPPRATLIASAPVTSLFGAEPLGERYFLARTLGPRSIDVAALLGAQPFGVKDLVDALEELLGRVADGPPPAELVLPGFLQGADVGRVERLFETLSLELSRLEREAGPAAVDALLERLRALPLVPDGHGGLHRPPRAGLAGIVRADARVRTALEGLWPFVAEALDPAPGETDASNNVSRASQMLDRLRVPRMDAAALVRMLEAGFSPHAPAALAALALRVRGEPARASALFDALADAPREIQQRAAALPLFATAEHGFVRLARDSGDVRGALVADAGVVSRRLAAHVRARRPVLDLENADAAVSEFVARAGAPTLGVETLVALAARDAEPGARDATVLSAWRGVLRDVEAELPERARAALAGLALWSDRRGLARPLVGPSRALVPVDEDVTSLFPDAVFLDEDSAAMARREGWGAQIVGADAVADALAAVPDAQLRLAAPSVAAAQRYLATHTLALSPAARERLALAPAFVCDRGTRTTLAALSLAEPPSLRTLWGDHPGRRFLDPSSASAELARALGLLERVQRAGVLALLADLSAAPDPARDAPPLVALVARDAGRLAALHALLAQSAAALGRSDLDRAVALPVFPDAQGRIGRLGNIRRGTDRMAVYPVDDEVREIFAAAGARVLAPGARSVLAPLLDAASVPVADFELLVDVLRRLPAVLPGQPPTPLQTSEILTRIQSVLVAHFANARPDDPSLLDVVPLAIWRTVRGGVVSAARLVQPAALLELTEPGTPERAMVEAVCLELAMQPRFEALAPRVRAAPPGPFVSTLVAQLARPGATLAEQPRFLSQPSRVAAVASLLLEGGERAEGGSVPRVDAAGRLRFAPLRRADEDALALVAGTAAAGDVLHPAFARAVPAEKLDAQPVVPREVLGAVFGAPAALDEPARRAALYRWLVAREGEVFSDESCRRMLSDAPAFVNERGQRVRAADLAIDAELPDLGLGWRPGDEIPAALVEALARHLGAGRIPLETLIERHLLPAYLRAAARGAGEQAAEILGYLARRLRGRSAAEVRAAMGLAAGAGALPLEAADGRFVPADQLILPAPEIAAACRTLWGDRYPQPSPARYGDALQPFLRDLGVPALPELSRVRALLDAPGRGDRLLALATLIGHLHRALGPALAQQLPLRATAWLPDGTGCPRPPAEIFLWSPEVEALAGPFPELYPDPAAAAALGEALCRELGFRAARDVRLDEVVHHLAARERARGTVPFRVYQWMEQGLAGGWLDGTALTAALDARNWIVTDEGGWFNHRDVLGSWEIQYFGTRRGYWERGRTECPRLCAHFGIPERATPATAARFLREIAGEVSRRGDREVLRTDTALPRMLLACYALMGESSEGIDPSLPVILCSEAGGSAEPARRGTLRLVAGSTPGLLRSDTPTLEALFAGAGRYMLAARGPADDRAEVDRFYAATGIPRLRDAYTLSADGTGATDRSGEFPGELGALRASLRALAGVLPRVRARRVLADDAGWVDAQKLAPLASAGAIRAVEGLRVRYRLRHVGEVSRETPAVFDAERGELWVDAATLTDAESQATGVALAILPAVYDGAGDEALADILEILLRLRTRDRMNAYLDRRHFPAAESEPGPAEALLERVDAALDYGLVARLARRFPVLAARELSRWRDASLVADLGADLLAQYAAGTREPAARALATRLLAVAGLDDRVPSGEALADALTVVLAAPTLADVPPGVLGARDDDGGDTDALGPIEGPSRIDRSGRLPAPGDASAWIQALAGAVRAASADAPGAAAGGLARSAGIFPGEIGSSGGALLPRSSNGAAAEDVFADGTGPLRTDVLALPATDREPEPSWMRRMLGWFGIGGRADAPEPVDPPWARPEANALSPLPGIAPQFWATPANRARVAATHTPAWLEFNPSPLAAPWAYGIHGAGVAFDPLTQTWSPAALPDFGAVFEARPTGRTVSFRGRIAAGTSVLPMPMFSRLAGPVRAAGGEAVPTSVSPDVGRRVMVHASSAVEVAFEVELLDVPSVLNPRELASVPGALTVPTLAESELPSRARAWLESERAAGRSSLARALSAQDFVRRNYAYDEAALERPEARRRIAKLEPGRGNHHLAVLHATRDRDVLGHGLCYELNVMVVELLRHLGVGAVVATGWVFDLGRVDRPDHLFALALLPSAAGPTFVPLDASVDERGPRHPLAARATGAAPGGVTPGISAPPGPWSVETARTPSSDVAAQLRALALVEASQAREEVALLARAVRLVCAALGRPEPATLAQLIEGSDATVAARARSLRELTGSLLPDRELLGALLALLRGDYEHLSALPPRVEDLVRIGLAQVRTVPAFRVVPAVAEPRE